MPTLKYTTFNVKHWFAACAGFADFQMNLAQYN